MARTFSGSDGLYTDSPPVVGPPLTFACWVKPTSIATNHTAMVISDVSSDYDYIHLKIEPTDYPSLSARYNPTGERTATATATVSADTWYHISGRSANIADRYAYLNGANQGYNGTTTPAELFDSFAIGYLRRLTSTLYFNGAIAEVAIWNADIGSSPLLNMATNNLSALYYKSNLVFYARLLEDEDYDEIGKITLSVTGSPGTDTHPTINYPTDIFGPKIQVI